MRVLVVAATEAEIKGLIDELQITNDDSTHPKSEIRSPKSEVRHPTSEILNSKSEIVNPKSEILITGVGMVATAFALGKHLAANQYDLVLNLGIAGSFDKDIALGDVVEITQDTIAELGAEDDEAFLPIDKMGFGASIFYPAASLSNLYNTSNHSNPYNLKTVTAITVNTVHGNESSIKRIAERLNPQLESMEGAAFFYACREMHVPCLQIRAVSNYVEKRNRDSWQIGLAIKNLNTFAVMFLQLYA